MLHDTSEVVKRGYEKMAAKLRKLGARIQRVEEK
jgi:UDP-N-acetylglucosamine enolpyruvyl transferase